MVSDLIIPTIEVPRGRVLVELFNERGRCVQREEGENFISPYAIDVCKVFQRIAWSQYFAGTMTKDAFGRTGWDIPPLPTMHVGCWNDASAEDSANERAVKGGPIIAAASRFPEGSPTGIRGIINTAESVSTLPVMTYVFDWLTSNGNGTFQSVGWINASRPSSGFSPYMPIGCFPDPFTGTAPLAVNIAGGNFYRGGLWHDGTNWLTLHVQGTTNGSGFAIYAVDPTTGVGTLVFNISSADFSFATSYGTFVQAIDLCKVGTDFYVIGTASAGGTTVAKYNSSGVQQWKVLHDGGVNEMPAVGTGQGWCITSDGTDLFVGFGLQNGLGGKVYKLSTSTGLVTATITPALTDRSICGIAYDGTNLRIDSNGFFWTMDKTTGAHITADPIVCLSANQDSGTATSPFTGTWVAPTPQINNAHSLVFNQNGTGGSMDDMNRNGDLGLTGMNYPSFPGSSSYPTAGGMHYRAGKLWWMGGVSNGSAVHTWITEVVYNGLGSRTKLASPVVKDSSKTMKITYGLTFA